MATLGESFRLLVILLNAMLWVLILSIPVLIVIYFALRQWIRKRKKTLMPGLRDSDKTITVGLFHPYCNAGGGGERVLWCAIRALQEKYPDVKCVVYTGDTDTTGEQIIAKARQRFNIILPRPAEFIFLTRRNWVEASTWPHFTLLGQSFGSLILGWEAMMNYIPDVYIDTMGYAFTLPLFKYLGGCPVGCYVHYPTISNDMLERVTDRTETYNNQGFISRSPALSFLKFIYYHIFAFIYGMAGKRSDTIMVNSSWTWLHIVSLWQAGERTFIVYPPCDTEEFQKIPLDDDADKNEHSIVSIAQFRPEKDHELQLQSFHEFIKYKSSEDQSKFELVLVGSCRNEEDSQRVENLRKLAKELEIEDYVEFKLNVSFEELMRHLANASIGIHTMWNEHFGIGVVEIMAAGTIILAHNSGGPQMDIVADYRGNKTGFLASTAKEYARAMDDIFNMAPQERLQMKRCARESVKRFSEQEFQVGFLSSVESLIKKTN